MKTQQEDDKKLSKENNQEHWDSKKNWKTSRKWEEFIEFE